MQYKRERSAWRAMIRRCTEPNHKDFPRYGQAGIRICPQWATFERFLADLGPAPTQRHWLGRLDVKGNYEPGNCEWTTQPPQERRRTFCRRVEIAGQLVTAAEAGRLPGQPTRNAVLRRMASGLPLDLPMAKLYRRSMWLTHGGETLPLPEWARRAGLPRAALWHRIKHGWPVERALTTPIKCA